VDESCGDGGKTTKKIYVEIVEFTTSAKFWTFETLLNNAREKRLVDHIKVSAGVYLDMGNTKDFINKNE